MKRIFPSRIGVTGISGLSNIDKFSFERRKTQSSAKFRKLNISSRLIDIDPSVSVQVSITNTGGTSIITSDTYWNTIYGSYNSSTNEWEPAIFT